MVVQGKSDSIPECDWKDQIQIIGWLYQYYNTEPKDKVFADLKKNIKKITKENILLPRSFLRRTGSSATWWKTLLARLMGRGASER
jgi:hypothetical protein